MPPPEEKAAPTTKSPDELLADEIVSALVDAELMDKSKAAEAKKKIAAGTMDQDDWRGLVEFKRPDAGGKSNG
jgi:hypothetical protein